jgi:hypothetical protein
LYVDGKTFTNEPIIQLVPKEDGSKIVTYTPSSASADVYARGKAQLINGEVVITFDNDFMQSIENTGDLVITVTANGNCNGVYTERVGENSFRIVELTNGRANVPVSWIAIGTRKGQHETVVSREILDGSFDSKMNGVMHHELDPNEGQPMYWNGSDVIFATPPVKVADPNFRSGSRFERR